MSRYRSPIFDPGMTIIHVEPAACWGCGGTRFVRIRDEKNHKFYRRCEGCGRLMDLGLDVGQDKEHP